MRRRTRVEETTLSRRTEPWPVFRVSHCFQQASFVTGRSTTNLSGLQYCKNVCPWNRSEGNNHSIYSSCENFNEGFIKSYNLFSLRIISYHRIISDRNLIVCSFDFIKIKICIKCPNKNFKILKSLIRILFYCITIIIFFFIEVQFSMIVKIKMWKENSSVKFIQYE